MTKLIEDRLVKEEFPVKPNKNISSKYKRGELQAKLKEPESIKFRRHTLSSMNKRILNDNSNSFSDHMNSSRKGNMPPISYNKYHTQKPCVKFMVNQIYEKKVNSNANKSNWFYNEPKLKQDKHKGFLNEEAYRNRNRNPIGVKTLENSCNSSVSSTLNSSSSSRHSESSSTYLSSKSSSSKSSNASSPNSGSSNSVDSNMSKSSHTSSSQTNLNSSGSFTDESSHVKSQEARPHDQVGWRLRETFRKSPLNPVQYMDRQTNRSSGNTGELSSTFSSDSSFSLSELSSTVLPFQNNIKSVTLCYYHHLFNQKKSCFNSDNSQPLYNYTFKGNEMLNKEHKFDEYSSSRFSMKTSESASLKSNEHSNSESFKSAANTLNSISKQEINKFCKANQRSIEKILSSFLKETKQVKFNRSNGLDEECSESRVSSKPPHSMQNASLSSMKSMRSSTTTSATKSSIERWAVKPYQNEFLNKSCSPFRKQTSSPKFSQSIYETLDSFGKQTSADNSISRIETSKKLEADTRSDSTFEINICGLNRSSSSKSTILSSKSNLVNKPLTILSKYI